MYNFSLLSFNYANWISYLLNVCNFSPTVNFLTEFVDLDNDTNVTIITWNLRTYLDAKVLTQTSAGSPCVVDGVIYCTDYSGFIWGKGWRMWMVCRGVILEQRWLIWPVFKGWGRNVLCLADIEGRKNDDGELGVTFLNNVLTVTRFPDCKLFCRCESSIVTLCVGKINHVIFKLTKKIWLYIIGTHDDVIKKL